MLEAKKILIIDDALDIQVVLRKFLENAGSRVEVATTGIEALSIAKANTFDLVLLDIHLPDMTGYEVMEELNKMRFDSPVYAFTALDDNLLNKSKLFELGFSGLLTKDFINVPLVKFTELISDILAA